MGKFFEKNWGPTFPQNISLGEGGKFLRPKKKLDSNLGKGKNFNFFNLPKFIAFPFWPPAPTLRAVGGKPKHRLLPPPKPHSTPINHLVGKNPNFGPQDFDFFKTTLKGPMVISENLGVLPNHLSG